MTLVITELSFSFLFARIPQLSNSNFPEELANGMQTWGKKQGKMNESENRATLL